MPYLNSSAIEWIDYDPASRTLWITFRGGRTYTLRKVPAAHYHGLLNAGSAGGYFNRRLKGRY